MINFSVRDGCGADCPLWLSKWKEWWKNRVREGNPLAMLRCAPDYYENLSREERRMVRNANRDYSYRTFDRNEHLLEIDAINHSKRERQDRPMSESYTTKAKPYCPPVLCDEHQCLWYGGFSRDTERLLAYAQLNVIGTIGILNTIIGHGKAKGIMNGLFNFMNDNANVTLINYLHVASSSDTLTAFKHRVGFRPWDAKTSAFLS